VDAFLRRYHPDYMEETKRSVSVGPNKGDIVPNEVADILEARCLVDPDTIDLEQGFGVLMATKLRIGDANTMMAEG
jgi:hypothetical protein